MGKKKPGFYRTTISISADLKQRMDKTKEAVNWSAVAAQAFESKLAEFAARKVEKTMDDVVQRLRASQQRNENEQFLDGFRFGQEWVKETAEANELKRLERFQESLIGQTYGWNSFFDSNYGSSAYTTAEHLAFKIIPSHDNDRGEASAFWEGAIGDDEKHRLDDDEFVRGFAEGALDHWADVKIAMDRSR